MCPKNLPGFALLLAIASVTSAAAADKHDAAQRERGANRAAVSLSKLINGDTVPATNTQVRNTEAGTIYRRTADGRSCATDGLIHAKVGATITSHVEKIVTLLEKNGQLRDVANLILPCGFRLDSRYGGGLVLTKGSEVRRYVENNAFGFAPAFGFGEKTTEPYTLTYETIPAAEDQTDDCTNIRSLHPDLQQCSVFGSKTALFGTIALGGKVRLAHFEVEGTKLNKDFDVADIVGHVESISFLPPPDASGGTITLVVSDQQGTFRVYVDTPRG